MDWTLDLDQDLDLDTGLDLELDNSTLIINMSQDEKGH